LSCSGNTLFRILTQIMSAHIILFVPVSSAPGVAYQLNIKINASLVVSFLMYCCCCPCFYCCFFVLAAGFRPSDHQCRSHFCGSSSCLPPMHSCTVNPHNNNIITRRVKSITEDDMAHQHFVQRISVAVQRGNAASVLGCALVRGEG